VIPDPAQTQRLADNLRAAFNRAVIDQAIGIILGRTGITTAAAFARIRAVSLQEHIKVSAIATRIVEHAAHRARVVISTPTGRTPQVVHS
jgi:AmiR/NasT family two-component response regulator